MKFKYVCEHDDLSLSPEEKQHLEREGQKAMFEAFFCTLLGNKYPDGVENLVSRVQDDLMRKLDKSQDGTLELESAELDLLKGLFLDSKLKKHPRQARYYHAIQRNLENAIEESKKKVE